LVVVLFLTPSFEPLKTVNEDMVKMDGEKLERVVNYIEDGEEGLKK
jgi:hypothetical protein